MVRGIRGAITVDQNTKEAIFSATVELLQSILDSNTISTQDIAATMFTVTTDLDAAYPAAAARTMANWELVPMTCSQEMDVANSLSMCIRVLMIINTEKQQKDIHHIYLRQAAKLRPDLAK